MSPRRNARAAVRARRRTGRHARHARARSASTSCATARVARPHRRPGGADRARPGRRDRPRARGAHRGAGRARPAGSWRSRSTRRWPRALRERFAGARPRRDPPGRRAAASTTRALRALRPIPAGRVLVVGNLPYSVGKPILAALLEAARGDRRDGAHAPAGGGRARRRGARAARLRRALGADPGRVRRRAWPSRCRPAPSARRPSGFGGAPPRDAPRRRRVPVADPARVRARWCAPPSASAGRAWRTPWPPGSAVGGRARPPAVPRPPAIDPGRRAETLSLAEFARLAAQSVGRLGSRSLGPARARW